MFFSAGESRGPQLGAKKTGGHSNPDSYRIHIYIICHVLYSIYDDICPFLAVVSYFHRMASCKCSKKGAFFKKGSRSKPAAKKGSAIAQLFQKGFGVRDTGKTQVDSELCRLLVPHSSSFFLAFCHIRFVVICIHDWCWNMLEDAGSIEGTVRKISKPQVLLQVPFCRFREQSYKCLNNREVAMANH